MEISGRYQKSINSLGTRIGFAEGAEFVRIVEGMEGLKGYAHIVIYRNGRSCELGRMFFKRISFPNWKADFDKEIAYREHIEETFEKYKRLKELSLPVVETLRVDPTSCTYLMTDLTDDGQNTIIDSHSFYEPYRRQEKVQRPSNFDHLQDELRHTADTAFNNGNGVYLKYASYSIVVSPNNIGHIMLFDIGDADILTNGQTKIGNTLTREGAINSVEQFIIDVNDKSQ